MSIRTGARAVAVADGHPASSIPLSALSASKAWMSLSRWQFQHLVVALVGDVHIGPVVYGHT